MIAIDLAIRIRQTNQWGITSMPFDRENASIRDLHERQLRIYQGMMHCGQWIVAAAALDYCREHTICPPPWVVEAASRLLCDLLRREKSNRRGRSCGYVARHRQDRIDYDRWDMVDEIRRRQESLKEEVETLRARPGVPPAMLDEREKYLKWAGSTLERECFAKGSGSRPSLAQTDRGRRICVDHRVGQSTACERVLCLQASPVDGSCSRNSVRHSQRPARVRSDAEGIAEAASLQVGRTMFKARNQRPQ
jgi:hypothetical protein